MMKTLLIVSTVFAFASSQYYGRPGSGGGGQVPGRGAPIIFPDEVHGGGVGGVGGVGGGGVGGGRPHPSRPQPGRPFPQQPSHPISNLSPIGHAGEPLYLEACQPEFRHSLIHQSFGGNNYHLSWCADGGRIYTWQGARDYCTRLGNGWYPVAIENRAEDRYLVDIIQAHRSPWIWTGGNRLNTKDFVWFDASPLRYTNWGQTGALNRPQPDNAEDNNEQCLAILNQFYNGDFITWHDIGCHHEKPVICEYSEGAIVGPQQPHYG